MNATVLTPTTQTITLREAIGLAIAEEMERDDSVLVIGEDVAGGAGMAAYATTGSYGGVFGVTKGLAERFGRDRVLDTPLSESAFMGMAVGAAMCGYRPIVELMFVDFLGVCLDPIYNQGAKVRSMSGGQASVPMVLRTTYGAGLTGGAQHSGCHYSVFAHFPGLKVVVPSNPADAQGLMTAAVRDDDIVVFFEHKGMYGLTGPAAPAGHVVPLGRCAVARPGADATVIGIGKTVHTALEAAATLAETGIECEVVDLRSLVPLDLEGIRASVRKTRHLVVVDEDSPNCSMATDVVARVCQSSFGDLDGAPVMVTPPSVPIPLAAELENAYLPSAADVIAAVHAARGEAR